MRVVAIIGSHRGRTVMLISVRLAFSQAQLGGDALEVRATTFAIWRSIDASWMIVPTTTRVHAPDLENLRAAFVGVTRPRRPYAAPISLQHPVAANALMMRIPAQVDLTSGWG